jgi:hypothetical protein
MNETPSLVSGHKILSFFGSDAPSARAAYMRFVEEGWTNWAMPGSDPGLANTGTAAPD